jgi:hypothetical protein
MNQRNEKWNGGEWKGPDNYIVPASRYLELLKIERMLIPLAFIGLVVGYVLGYWIGVS